MRYPAKWAAAAGMFVLVYMAFAYLAVATAFVLPAILLIGYLFACRLKGTALPLLAAFAVAPLLSPETFAGWSRMLQGHNPGGPNGMLVVIHIALVLLGSAVIGWGSRRYSSAAPKASSAGGRAGT